MVWIRRLGVVVLLLLLTAGVVACRPDPQTAVTAGQLTDLTGVAQLQSAFEAGNGRTRLLLILAPT